MANSAPFKIRRKLSEMETGSLYQAQDASGHAAHLLKYTSAGKPLASQEEVAYQVCIGRLSGIHHPSLRAVIAGGSDPEDGAPYLMTKPVKGQPLSERLEAKPLSVEATTTMLSQLLELSELLSHLLADEGVWVETRPESILIVGEGADLRFVFWPSPLKAVSPQQKAEDFSSLIALAEKAVNWEQGEVDEREGGHLQLWLKWLTEASAGDGATIREMREMLAAAAGVEPPEPIESLVEASRHDAGGINKLSKLLKTLKLPAPKMPLFVLLCAMLVIQACIGWVIMRSISQNIDEELKKVNSGYTDSPYTINRDPTRANEPGSQPLDFD